MKTAMYYDKRNNHIYCTHAFEVKENLKALGYRWNSIGSAWFIAMPKDSTTLANLICDTVVACGIDYADFCAFMALSLPAEHAEVLMSMDEEHIAKMQTAFGC